MRLLRVWSGLEKVLPLGKCAVVQSRRREDWCAREASNLRPPGWGPATQSVALIALWNAIIYHFKIFCKFVPAQGVIAAREGRKMVAVGGLLSGAHDEGQEIHTTPGVQIWESTEGRYRARADVSRPIDTRANGKRVGKDLG